MGLASVSIAASIASGGFGVGLGEPLSGVGAGGAGAGLIPPGGVLGTGSVAVPGSVAMPQVSKPEEEELSDIIGSLLGKESGVVSTGVSGKTEGLGILGQP